MNLSSSMIPLEMLASCTSLSMPAYRTTAHDTERDLRAIIRKFIAIKNNEKIQSEPLLQMLSQGKEELLSLKRKLSQKFEQQYSLYDNCKKRIHRHEELKQDVREKPYVQNQEKVKFEFNSHIVQYLRSKRQLEKAKMLSKALKEEVDYDSIQNMFDLETNLLQRALDISRDILSNKFDSLKQWIHENHHNLDKTQSTIHFQLTCCEFINQIFDDEPVKACMQLRKKLSNIKLNKNQQKIVEKLTYLLIDSQTNPPKLQQFLATLQDTFKKAFSEIYFINFDSQLQRNLIVGISSLKTVCCCKSQTKNQQICPICTQRASQLAQRIPMLTKQTSSLKCRINQSIMDEENYPIALPSGNIYSVSGLNATSEDDQYYCLLTQTWYPKNQAKKVFLA